MPINSEHFRYVSLLSVFTLAYVLTGMVGLTIQTGHDGITPIWPPSGIALYAFIRFGPRMWPIIVVSVFILGWLYNIPPPAVAVAAFGNTCEALLGWYLSKRARIEFGKSLKDAWNFLLLPVLVAPVAGASIGTLGMVLGDAAEWQATPFMWLMWWLGDACGILLFTPLLFGWIQRPTWFHSTPRMFEWAVVTGFSIFLGWYTFVFEQQQLPGETVNIMFLVTPFLLWASIRLGLRGATLISLIACSWVLWGAASGTGPFAMDNVRMTGMIESSFIFVITLTALIVQALFREHMLDIVNVRKANDVLAERVRDRTIELERLNEELTAAKETAERANASKTRFLVAASHDLRQPLQALTTHTDILGMRVQPEAAGDIEHLRNAGRTMSSILDMLVDISKLESGEISRDIRAFPINSLLEELRKQHAQQAAAKHLELHVNDCDRNVLSDRTLLRLILQNLISNAISYTDTGSIEVDCIVRDGVLRIAVTDTGIGIDKADQDIIFEEFYQLDNPARDRDRGMGMGLAIVRRMAALLDHPLHLRSVPGKGSTFAIDVPTAADMCTSASGRDSPVKTQPGEPAGSILLVDDDPTVLASLRMLLETMGYRVHAAAGASSARTHVSNGNDFPDLIITDFRLPEATTGTTLVEQIRDQAGRRIPAIILSGDITLGGLEDGVADCTLLRKPVIIGDLEQAIRQQLDAGLKER
jgi:signal transduction histidine kinase/CheY-like chemotaxis protein